MSTESLTPTTGKQDLVFTRIFNTPVEQVWRAWTDAEQVRRWWGPNGFTSPLARIDFREGGTSLLCMSSPDHGVYYSTWHYRKIMPMKLIEYVHNLADEDGNKVDPVQKGMPADFPQDMIHTITFKVLESNQTELIVTEHNWTIGQMMELSKMGMEQCLDKMETLLSGGV